MKDPIVEEVRMARDAFAKRFGYNVDQMCENLRLVERKAGRLVVEPSARNTARRQTGVRQRKTAVH